MRKERINQLNDKDFNFSGKYVLYCMENAQREDYNHALEFAIQIANQYTKPVVVAFFITDKYKYSNQRYYRFMLEGIIKTKNQIQKRGINFVIKKDDFVNGCLSLSKDAFCIVFDKSYLKTQRNWRYKVAEKSDVKIFEVETDVIVPIEVVSKDMVPYAYIYRKKLENLFFEFLYDYQKLEPKIKTEIDLESLNFEEPQNYLDILNIDKSISTVEKYYKGGFDEAENRLKDFIERKLSYYKEFRSDPSKDYQSNLSPYLHFGQISSQKIMVEILKHYDFQDENIQSFYNEAVVWRELARNFCYYNSFYNYYEGIPEWAKKTLEEHLSDKREYIYDIDILENAKTHDIYWNAAQKELLITGKMHNYMRMYWAKKLIEWTDHPQKAFDIACYLNDKYELDGRDPNGYAGISWCFGTHDRPWTERKIFGKIRYMNDKGLERKFDIHKYVKKWITTL
ncbi:deoxyribodipyrimidine photo-lyase [Venenivibrio stagnispumantis]|uniref:Deoxyribodipyrimidine photo-lyase n=1 Tax=Venenivibrio stagnispumantis TaxID=407998 RepID=A0AA45WMH3_9AQUI|nr:deoxyribodipyrimidine photo-lyase [Venenivibrio stagnispumantis]MCW4573628.1 deoxyribodipyrimidine photo-lyase [Venenivibrio stagnispumantis]SMP14249.1 deoxyribodipyrimidine photo-lyase [Venenivibrio stagnispumantis]